MVAIRRGALVLFCLVASVGALAGCTTATEGAPTSSSPQEPSSAESSSTSSTSGSPAADSALAAVDPCSLVTAPEAAQVGGQGPGEVRDASVVGATSECRWHGRTPEDYSLTFGIDIRASQGVDELQANGGQITNGKVGTRTARRLGNGTSCIVTLKVGPKSRVDVTAVVSGVTEPTEPCQIASKVGGFVDPRLPPEQN